MAFIEKGDIKNLISTDKLDVILRDNDNNITKCLFSAIGEVKGYIAHRYDTTKIFKDVTTFGIATTYAADDIVELNETAYDEETEYSEDDYCSYESLFYKSLADENTGNTPDTSPTKWEYIGYNYGIYICTAASTENDVNDSDYWKPSQDFQKLRDVAIDICIYHLHANIQPRNIPQLRIDRRDEAIEFLKAVQKGLVNMDFPLYSDTDTGQRISYGSNTKRPTQRY